MHLKSVLNVGLSFGTSSNKTMAGISAVVALWFGDGSCAPYPRHRPDATRTTADHSTSAQFQYHIHAIDGKLSSFREKKISCHRSIASLIDVATDLNVHF